MSGLDPRSLTACTDVGNVQHGDRAAYPLRVSCHVVAWLKRVGGVNPWLCLMAEALLGWLHAALDLPPVGGYGV